MPITSLILADDLTGALDSAVGFADPDVTVLVARSADAIPVALDQRPDVLSVNTSSREIAPERAAERIAAALAHLDPAHISLVFKKVDSRLKGNVGIETAALAEWAGRSRSLACPAIPGMGRRVERGALSGSGVATPIPVAACFDHPVEVPDVHSDEDLDALCVGSVSDTLWIGARGLSFALARSLGVAAPASASLKEPILILNGSRDPVTLAQVEALKDISAIVSAPDGMVPDTTPQSATTLLDLTDGGANLSGPIVAERFAEGAAKLARRCQPAALLICGGETAQACLDQFGLNSLRVKAELRPGLPVCEADLGWGQIQIVTKSGGFGAADLLADIVKETGGRV
ncbi:MAG: hypothetical protein MRY75_02775 [Marivita sp.]|uniref:four-carbon acid sugar kinase family protein n=1 Tax=Marivita sp. TaxID=2003365 RepID=UPI0025BD6DA9|nr:four-carbon acid sugar kinase family protein [Marivita sp.]MCI5109452.1 hypothetical protein [Marivita sp.]